MRAPIQITRDRLSDGTASQTLDEEAFENNLFKIKKIPMTIAYYSILHLHEIRDSNILEAKTAMKIISKFLKVPPKLYHMYVLFRFYTGS